LLSDGCDRPVGELVNRDKFRDDVPRGR
jgi:hypothetical protein